MGNLTGRMPTRGIQNPIPTKVELWAYDVADEKWQKVKTDALNHYATNDVDRNSDTITYEGLEESEGGWQVVKTTKGDTITTMRFASIKNNPAISDYPTAWANRLTLTYDYYSLAL